MHNHSNEVKNDYIIGRNAVREALKSGRIIDSVLISTIEGTGSLKSLLAEIKDRNITIKQVNQKVLNSMSGNISHQGIIAISGAKESSSIKEILEFASKKNEQPFIIVADGIEDPHNLGAIIRTAECVGAHGVIIPKRRAVGLTGAVEKCSAGALEHVLIAKVNNISSAVEELKKEGLWIYGADMMGKMWCSEDLTGAVALVIGSEGRGISQKVKEKCDFILSLPLQGKINSLNASVAAGVLMYEVRRQRGSV